MLSVTDLRSTARRRRAPYSDKQHYQEYILQRIEGYKNSIGRDELLRLGDEAAGELAATSEGQFVLTEVLMLETVDRLIMKRLALRPYRRWRQQFIKLREAQRTPTHWGLEPACALGRLVPRVEPRDAALVVGNAGESAAYLLAAHDASVTFVASDLGCVERVESRMAAESLSWAFDAYVAQLGASLPCFLDLDALHVVVLDPAAIAEFPTATRAQFLDDLQRRSRPGALHVILGSCPGLAPHSLRSLYEGWEPEEDGRRRRRGSSRRADDLILAKPACPPDTRAARVAASI